MFELFLRIVIVMLARFFRAVIDIFFFVVNVRLIVCALVFVGFVQDGVFVVGFISDCVVLQIFLFVNHDSLLM